MVLGVSFSLVFVTLEREVRYILILFIKYFTLMICCFYTCIKLLHISLKKNVYLSLLVFMVTTLPLMCIFRTYIKPFSFFIFVILISGFVIYNLRISIRLAMIVSMISFGIAYVIFMLAAAITYPLGFFISIFTKQYPSDFICMILIGFIQILLILLPFKIRRFRNGMSFLYDRGASDIGFFISINILLTVSYYSLFQTAYLVFTIPIFFIILSGITLFLWWKKSLTKKYIDKLNHRELDTLQNMIRDKDLQIEDLKYHNSELSKIIHKDNKLIPSMELAVREYLITIETETNPTLHIEKGKDLIKQLRTITKERRGILSSYENKNQSIDQTEVQSIDHTLSYMYYKAQNFDIGFDLILNGSTKYLVEHIIQEEDLRILLGDLIENAIIATKTENQKKIMVNMGIVNECYSIEVFDSGCHFPIDVLLNLGLKQTTTHGQEGGSGIGLMTSYELITKYQASFVIEEFEDNIYIKKVSIVFDNLGQVRIHSIRPDVITTLSFRNDIIVIYKSRHETNRSTYGELQFT